MDKLIGSKDRPVLYKWQQRQSAAISVRSGIDRQEDRVNIHYHLPFGIVHRIKLHENIQLCSDAIRFTAQKMNLPPEYIEKGYCRYDR